MTNNFGRVANLINEYEKFADEIGKSSLKYLINSKAIIYGFVETYNSLLSIHTVIQFNVGLLWLIKDNACFTFSYYFNLHSSIINLPKHNVDYKVISANNILGKYEPATTIHKKDIDNWIEQIKYMKYLVKTSDEPNIEILELKEQNESKLRRTQYNDLSRIQRAWLFIANARHLNHCYHKRYSFTGG